MIRALALALLLCLAGSADAQIIAQRIVSQPITTAGTDCSTTTTCVVLPDVFRTSTGSIDIAATIGVNGTVQFEGSIDCTTWRALLVTPLSGVTQFTPAVTSSSGPGTWTWTQALCGVRVRASTLTSGTFTVSIIAR